MIRYHDQTITGLIIAVNRYGDDSAVVTLATDGGLKTCIARDVYRPRSTLKAILIIGDVVTVDIRTRENDNSYITSASTELDLSTIHDDLVGMVFLSFISQLSLELFMDGDSYPLDEVSAILTSVKQNGDILTSALLCLGSFYRGLGSAPDVTRCVRCGVTKNIVAFEMRAGGFICERCLNGDSRRSDLELQVIKFTFSRVEQKNLQKRVPVLEGKKVLRELTTDLLEAYDIHRCPSLEMLLELL